MLFAGALLVMPACVSGQPAVPATPVPVRAVLYARPFTLQTPYRNHWSRERGVVTSGVLVVLEADPALAARRNSLEPVLYAGDVAVQTLNDGGRSGRVIGIIPGDVDLATTPIWFGTPQLPERLTAADVRAERARAERAGIRPFDARKLAAVRRPPVAVADVAALLRDVAAELVYEYSPQERELADGWRLPTAKAAPRRNPQ